MRNKKNTKTKQKTTLKDVVQVINERDFCGQSVTLPIASKLIFEIILHCLQENESRIDTPIGTFIKTENGKIVLTRGKDRENLKK